MPLAEIITFGSGSVLSHTDSWLVLVNLRFSKSRGLSPFAMYSFVSSSKTCAFFLKTSVAVVAIGLSTYTFRFLKASWYSLFDSYTLFSSYISSCVLPTANDGITVVPPFSAVSRIISSNFLTSSGFFGCSLLPYVVSMMT